MAAKFVAAIDHGTTSTRCILFDARRRARSRRAARADDVLPAARLGRARHGARSGSAPRSASTRRSARRARLAGGRGGDRDHERTRAVVLWDRRTGRPVARSITWQDTRTAAAADALAADGGIDRFQQRTGLPISTYSSALKLRGCSTRTRPGGTRPSAATCCSARRTLAPVEPHRRSGRRGARDRSDQRQPHAADEPAARSNGTTSCSTRWGSRARCFPRSAHRARCTAWRSAICPACLSRASSATSRRRCSVTRASTTAT